MKHIHLSLVGILLLGVAALIGCSKKESNDTIVKEQYVGTFQGTLVYNDGTAQPNEVTLSIILSNGVLTGYLKSVDDPYAYRLREVSFEEGVLHISVVCITPEDPDCANWSVTGTLSFVDNILIVNISGTFCGNIHATITGNIPRIDPEPEISSYITFAQVGREWQYRVTAFNGMECLMTFALTNDLGNGVFAGIFTTDCGWTSGTPFWWYVSPNAWCDMMSADLNTRILNILSDAEVGDIYQTIQGDDTTTVTVLSVNDPVVIDGITYSCYKLLKKTTQFGSYSEGYAWMTFDIGMIKYEAILPANPTDVQTEELIIRNF